MNLSFIIPTRNRSAELAHTLKQLSQLALDSFDGGAELIVVDNDSHEQIKIPGQLENGMRIHTIALDQNLNTGARNIGAQQASGDWLVMLDDDSSPLSGSDWSMLARLPSDVGAVGGEIVLPDGSHEAGGLPEVVIGCGCAIRRELFLELGGYDQHFGYYAEEYDLCARIIKHGSRVVHSRALRFEHRKVQQGRNFKDIIYRLTRNNAWIMARYAPEAIREAQIQVVVDRYCAIAEKEGVLAGFERAMSELDATLGSQERSPLSDVQWDRFIGRAAARSKLHAQFSNGICTVEIVGGANAKGRREIEQELRVMGFEVVETGGDVQIIGSLSPGVILDLHNEFPQAVSAWDWYSSEHCSAV